MALITVLANALIFDLDGTLIDSSALYERVWQRWSERVGVSAKKVLQISHGRRHQDVIQLMLPKHWKVEDALAIFYEEEDKENNTKEITGAKKLLSQLPLNKWAIVTSSGRSLTKKRLADCGLPVPDLLITAEDVSVGKPDPTGYNLAVSKLKMQPCDCWVFEDAHNGIQAAKLANLHVIVITGTFDETDFSGNITIPNFKRVKYLGLTAEGKIHLEVLI